MKNVNFEALMIAAKPADYPANDIFTDSVMEKIQKSEILSSAVRNMDVNKKETFIMKLIHLPKLAIVAIAIGATLLVSGSAYAIYSLWGKPSLEVSQPKTSASGRQEVSIAFSSCGTSIMPNKYELKRNATINANQIEAVVKAHCELQAINDWAMKTYAQGTNGSFGDARTNETPAVKTVRQLASINESSITFAELKNKLSTTPQETLDTPNTVRFIANGVDTSRSTFKPGDAVAYVTLSRTVQTPKEQCTSDACREFGEYRGVDRLVAVIKLDRPFQDYSNDAWESIAELGNCIGNEKDLCLQGNAASTSLFEQDIQSTFNDTKLTKDIEGVVTSIENGNFTIKSTSGTTYTIVAPTRIFTDFNTGSSASLHDVTANVGSTVSVRYIESKSQHDKTISTDKIQNINLRLEILNKGGDVKAY